MNNAEKLAKSTFSEEDFKTIEAEIKSFENKTSGELIVQFNTNSYGQPYKKAKRIFEKHNMHQTKERNAVLFVLFLKEQKFAVYGDKGINEKVPEGFWNDVTEGMSAKFSQNEFGIGLIEGIRKAGEKLAEYFPVQQDDTNELSDELLFSTEDE
jgi:uncharacterized membrane protein